MPNFITEEGLEKFKQEQQERIERRKQIGKKIQAAKELGDLSENAEYSAAKAEQGENERRLNFLRRTIEKSQVIKTKNCKETVEIGCMIDLVAKSNKNKLKIQLVGVSEVNPAQGKISHASPIGRAIMGKRKGDKVSVETPRGREEYEIRGIE